MPNPSPARDILRLDQPGAGLQRLAARFAGHAYDRHRHETYAVGLTLRGLQAFHCRGTLRASRAGQVIVIHPDEPHDGHAGAPGGFAYHMLYLDPAQVVQALGGTGTPPFVPEVVAADPTLAALLAEAFTGFPAALDPLAVDAVTTGIADAMAHRSDGRAARRAPPGCDLPALHRARACLASSLDQPIGSAELEHATGLDRFDLARQFRRRFATSPHRYRLGRRLARAQDLIAAGAPLADVAAATGFADQSHLTRHFKSRFGIPPGRWRTLRLAA
jgi:AraC-like DNA-binding protein